MACDHPNLKSTARSDYCPDCKYEYYYGDVHASGDAQISKLVNQGEDVLQVEKEFSSPDYCRLCRSFNCDGYCDCPD